MTESPVELLAKTAAAFGVRVIKTSRVGLELDVPVPLPDQSAPDFQISLTCAGSRVTARELAKSQLPDCCPDRHINPGGSFCLGWDDHENLEVTDDDTAKTFWAKLIKFLRYQVMADASRRWPGKQAWAHGSAAAPQRKAIDAADALAAELGKAVRRGRLTVLRKGDGALGPALRVLLDGKRLFAVWEKDKRLVNLRRPCFCTTGPRPRRIAKHCLDHKEQAVQLALALRDWSAEEKRFWAHLKGTPCCGTIDNCPLR